ncbi:MAG: hypothetical protein ACTSPJ_04645 [Candidatus Heimdallarchaeaceae archaeon]
MSKTETKQQSPLERGVRKIDVLMRSFGMRTRMFKGKTRGIVKGTRKVYPHEVNATIVETARGVGIKIKMEKLWYSFLKGIPFLFLIILALIQLIAPKIGENMAENVGFNLFALFLGTRTKSIGLLITLFIIGGIFIVSEIIERTIRLRYLQDRMPRFLSGAEWTTADSPLLLDIISSTNNILWLAYLILVIIFAPFSFSSEIIEKFVTVYQTGIVNLLEGTTLVSLLDISIISSMLFTILLLNYKSFREEIDSKQRASRVKVDYSTTQLLEVVFGSITLITFEIVLFSFMFWTDLTLIQIIMTYSVTVAASILSVWLYWQRENYIFIFLEIWLFLSIVVMVFSNANNPKFSWMIICHLFLILTILGLYFNQFFKSYLEEKGIYEPSWMFNSFPIFAIIEVLKKAKVRTTKGVQKELEEIRTEELTEKIKERSPLIIPLEKITKKGKDAKKIINTYQKIIDRITKKDVNIITLSVINEEILALIQDEAELRKKVENLFQIIDHLLWDESYILKDGSKYVEITEQLYSAVLKAR